MAAYVKVANAADLQPGQAMSVTAGDRRVALFNVGGTCYAIDDTCTHRGGPLSEGALEKDVVTCPWHMRPLLCARWSGPGTTGFQERRVVPGARGGRQYRNRGVR